MVSYGVGDRHVNMVEQRQASIKQSKVTSGVEHCTAKRTYSVSYIAFEFTESIK